MGAQVNKLFDVLEEFSEMADEPQNSPSHRYAVLAAQMHDKEFRDSYAATHTRQFIARQIRAFRNGMNQKEFGEAIGQKQSAVSRFEDPNYGRETLQTLFDIASKLNVMFIGRFVDAQTFLKLTDDMSDAAARPEPYDQQRLADFVRSEVEQESNLADLVRALQMFKKPIETVDVGKASKAAQDAQSKAMDLRGPERIDPTWMRGAPGPQIKSPALV